MIVRPILHVHELEEKGNWLPFDIFQTEVVQQTVALFGYQEWKLYLFDDFDFNWYK